MLFLVVEVPNLRALAAKGLAVLYSLFLPKTRLTFMDAPNCKNDTLHSSEL